MSHIFKIVFAVPLLLLAAALPARPATILHATLDLAVPARAAATRYNPDLTGYAIADDSPVEPAGWGLGGDPGGSAGVRDLPIELPSTTSCDTNTPGNPMGLGNAGDSGEPLLYHGYGILSNGGRVSWLKPVPFSSEPGTWVLAVGGVLLVLLRPPATR